MGRRIFFIASVLSLVMCAATVVLWVRSFRSGDVYQSGELIFISSRGRLVVVRSLSDNVAYELVTYSWCAGLFSVLPIIWLFVRWRGGAGAGSGLCPTCGYDLTGNTSGVCPECGAAVTGRAGA